MTQLEHIQSTIRELPLADLVALRRWLDDEEWQAWDKQLEQDITAGRLDFLEAEALEAEAQGLLQDL